MTITDLQSFRQGRALDAVKRARLARDRIDLVEQAANARLAADQVECFSDEESASIYARALEFEVDALLNSQDGLRAGMERAAEGARHVRSVSRAEAAVRAIRVRLTAIELGGDPYEAMYRFAVHASDMWDVPWTELERLRAFQHVLTAAKRQPLTDTVRHFVHYARKHGDELADQLVNYYPDDVAYYRQWAAVIEQRTLGYGGNPDRAVELLDLSLASRPSTPRADATVGMALAERSLAGGDRNAGIEQFATTLAQLAVVLPRHHESATRMIVARGLRAA
jgi:hypothetical protein